VSKHYKTPSKSVGIVQSGPHNHLIEINLNCSRLDIAEQLLSLR